MTGEDSVDKAVVPLLAELPEVQIYDLAKPLQRSTPFRALPFTMSLLRRHGDNVREGGTSSAVEIVTTILHMGTHIDALSHFSHEGRLFGGIDAVEASRGGRFRHLGVETVPPLLCRGVLLDVARTFGVKALDPGQPITESDLQETCRRENVEIRAGDSVFIRTGWGAPEIYESDEYGGLKAGGPGPNEAAAVWLADQGIVLSGADTKTYECHGVGDNHDLPVHRTFLVDRGIYIIECMDLEALARDHTYEFLFIAAPLAIVGATGSPLRPLAVAFRAQSGANRTSVTSDK